MRYKAFISYNHNVAELAAALGDALQQFAPPARGEPGIRVFRDASNLSATPELWPSIQQALDDSDFLLLIASEEAAKSKWVANEIQHWRAHPDPGRLLIMLAGGTIAWDGERGDFDFARSTALPPSIGGAFKNEPLFVDFSGILPQHYDLNHPAFCDKVATVASALRGVSKDDLFGIHVSRRIAAEAARLATEADLALRDGLPERSLLLSGAALTLTDDRGEPRATAAEAVLRSALTRFGGRPLGSLAYNAITPPVAFDRNGRWLVTIDQKGLARARDLSVLDADAQALALDHGAPVATVEFTADGRWLVSQSNASDANARLGVTIRLWDAGAGFSEWHDVPVPEGTAFTCAVLSAERTHLTAGCEDGTIRIWALEDGARNEPLVVLNAGGAVRLLACAAQERRVGALAAGKSLQAWDLGGDQAHGSHAELASLPTPIADLAFSPDGGWLLCGGETSFLLSFPRDKRPQSMVELTAYRGRIWKHAFSDDGLWLATATGPTGYDELIQAYYPESTARLWDLHRLKSWELIGHEDIVSDVAITPDGSRVVSTSLDRTMRVWDFSTLRRFQQARMKQETTGDASWRQGVPGGDVDAHESYVAQQAFRDHKTLLGGEDAVFHCVPSPDGRWLATVAMGQSASARFWRVDTGFGASPIHLPNIAPPDALAWISPTQKWFFYAALAEASGGTVQFSARHEWLLMWVQGHLVLHDVLHDRGLPSWTLDEPFESAHLSPDGCWLALRANGILVLRGLGDEASGTRTIASDIGPVRKVLFSACGRWLITVEGDESVCVRDLRSADVSKAQTVLRAGGGEAPSIAIDPAGRLLFAGGNRGWASVWQMDEAGQASVFTQVPGHKAELMPGVIHGRFTADGRWLMTSDLGLLQVWDLVTRERRLAVVQDAPKTGFDVELTSDGRWLVVSRFGRLVLFDMQATGKDVAPVVVREYGAGHIRFAVSADSRWLVTADAPIDTPGTRAAAPTVRVHDLWAPNVAGSAVELPGGDNNAQRIGISWDSRWLTTTGTGVRVWPLGVPELLEVASQTVGRGLTDEERSRYLAG